MYYEKIILSKKDYYNEMEEYYLWYDMLKESTPSRIPLSEMLLNVSLKNCNRVYSAASSAQP